MNRILNFIFLPLVGRLPDLNRCLYSSARVMLQPTCIAEQAGADLRGLSNLEGLDSLIGTWVSLDIITLLTRTEP